MLHHRGRVFGVVAAIIAIAAPAVAEADSVTPVEKKVTSSAYGQIGVKEESTNKTPLGTPYGRIGAAWCADFIKWVLSTASIAPGDSGRALTKDNWYVAKAWAYYGSKNGGYGRWGTTHNAMPGDLVIDRYDGTASTGGHISMVLRRVDSAHPDKVWTVGGNEDDAVRLTQKDLDNSSRYLVTLKEFRDRSSVLYREYNTQLTNVGSVTVHRDAAANGPATLQITKVAYGANVYTGSSLNTNWLLQSGTRTWSGTTDLNTETVGTLSAVNAYNENLFSSLTVAPIAIDPAKSSTYTSDI